MRNNPGLNAIELVFTLRGLLPGVGPYDFLLFVCIQYQQLLSNCIACSEIVIEFNKEQPIQFVEDQNRLAPLGMPK